ncbi:MAG: outer membrane beta-barrel protein [Pseudomonadota bacterium]
MTTPFRHSLLIALLLAGPQAAVGVQRALAQEPTPAIRPTIMAGPSIGRDDLVAGPETGTALPPVLPEDEADVRDGDPARSRADGLRPAVQDGAPPPDEASLLLRDGVIDVGEPEDSGDGADPAVTDARSRDDIALFENPRAPDDVLLFQIEELEPIADRRIRRLFAREPFDPVGIRVGSFVLFTEAEVYALWSSNVFRSPIAEGDSSLWVRPYARLVSDWRAHALEFRAEGTFSRYADFSSEDDNGYALDARGRLDVTRRTDIQGGLMRTEADESRSAIDASSAGERPRVTTDQAALAARHRFNRLTLQLRGAVTDTDYSDTRNGTTLIRNDDRDVRQGEVAARASWEFKPTLSAFTDVALVRRDHAAPATSDGLSRDSNGERYRIGLSFGSTGAYLRGEASLGYGRQEADDVRLAVVDGLLFDANLAWRMSEITTLLLTGRSDIEDSTTAGTLGAMTREFGLEARHALRRHLVASAGINLLRRDFAGIDIAEREVRTALGLEYFLAREAVLFGRYQHTDFRSDQPASDFVDDEVRVGVRLRR